MNDKFELTSETKVAFGVTFYRIKALKDFGDVHAEELGGWVEEEDNLDFMTNAWIGVNSYVWGDSRVENYGSVENGSTVNNSRVENYGSVENGSTVNNSRVNNSKANILPDGLNHIISMDGTAKLS